jgi:hypothetical protein
LKSIARAMEKFGASNVVELTTLLNFVKQCRKPKYRGLTPSVLRSTFVFIAVFADSQSVFPYLQFDVAFLLCRNNTLVKGRQGLARFRKAIVTAGCRKAERRRG